MSKSRKPAKKLPNSILPIECSDKSFMEVWKPGRNVLDFPWSFRWSLVGNPGSGKSTIIKNHIIRANPPYEKVIVCHYDAEGTTEFDDCGDVEYIDKIPNPKEINPDKQKMLLIIEDMNLATLPKQDKENLNRLFGYASSHRGVSIAITAQNPTDICVAARRMCNIFTIFKIPDLNGLMMLASRTGYKKEDFVEFFKLCQRRHDNITIDLTDQSPMPLRFNLFNEIKQKEDSDEE